MNTSFPLRAFVTAGLIVLGLYFAVFYGIEGCRSAKGPWQVTFTTSNDFPLILVSQPRLRIAAQFNFPGEKTVAANLPRTVAFDRPKQPIPFGKVIYEDLTQLPGVVTFDLFGHEIELLPRALIVNKREIPWNSQPVLDLSDTNKPVRPPQPAPGWK